MAAFYCAGGKIIGMRRSRAQWLFALGVVAFIWAGIPIAAKIDNYDGPAMFAAGVIVSGIILERIIFRNKPSEPRGFPIKLDESTSDPIQAEVRAEMNLETNPPHLQTLARSPIVPDPEFPKVET